MKTYLSLFFTFLHLLLYAQNGEVRKLDNSRIKPADIDATVIRLMAAAKIPGLGLSILNNNQVVYKKAYGFRNNDQQLPLDTSSVLYAASFSKAVFAFITLHLVQDHVIDLDEPLFLYMKKPLSDYPQYKDVASDERWKMITARICLSHTTGLPNIWWMNARTGEIDTVSNFHLFFTPGTRYAYSGEGLKLLQLVIEQLTGKDLEQLATTILFHPAGMTRTSYTWQPAFDENSAWGHDEQGKAIGKQKAGKPGAAGSMLTTISDYSRFIAYVMQGKGLRPEYLKMMESPQVTIHSKTQFPPVSDETTTENDNIQLSYGLGWGVIQTKYGPAFFKEGHHDYWRNYNINFPGKKTAIIIMTNSANGEGIFKELLDSLIGDSFTPWKWEGYIPYEKS